MGFMMLFWVIILAFVIMAILRHRHGYGRCCGHDHGHDHGYDPESPQEIIRRRYAKGELTKEQFEQMLKDLA